VSTLAPIFAIARDRNRYRETPFRRATTQVVIVGALMRAAGILTGSG